MCEACPTQRSYTRFPACFQKYPGRCQKKNPGSIQELHQLAHNIMPRFFDGIELDYFYRLSANKIITSNWVLSHTRPSGFRFGGIYTIRMHDDVMQTPTIHANINPSTLSSNVGIIYYPFHCLRMETELQRAGAEFPLQTQTTLEVMRPCATLTCNLYNVSRHSGRGTLSFMRAITEHWSLGAELLVEWTDPKSVMADTAFAARYSLHASSVAATMSRQGLDVSYWQRLNNRIQMATMFAYHRKTQRSIATTCYQWDFTDAYVRGMFDSDLSVGFMYVRNMPHIPCSVGMSLLISLPSNRFIFGLKFNLDPSGFRRGE